ncbi:hypothetical protein MESS2_440091 [Mesorhizobium metallidurans STM 2683]|uniref:Uncharacterized protein n=1 Tax=Mesorhizobium metallidurans STM 2683 TaxID=1297569 RepID=M5F524_9HYPH|nr:hypothetical protein MESS2_440091 [Mesorhizobium metallidurans STM 2683]
MRQTGFGSRCGSQVRKLWRGSTLRAGKLNRLALATAMWLGLRNTHTVTVEEPFAPRNRTSVRTLHREKVPPDERLIGRTQPHATR